MLEFADENGMAEMQIGRGRIESRFYAERFAGFGGLLKSLAEFGLTDYLRCALLYICELLFNRWKRHAMWLNSSVSRVSVRSCILGEYSKKCGVRRCASRAASSR